MWRTPTGLVRGFEEISCTPGDARADKLIQAYRNKLHLHGNLWIRYPKSVRDSLATLSRLHRASAASDIAAGDADDSSLMSLLVDVPAISDSVPEPRAAPLSEEDILRKKLLEYVEAGKRCIQIKGKIQFLSVFGTSLLPRSEMQTTPTKGTRLGEIFVTHWPHLYLKPL